MKSNILFYAGMAINAFVLLIVASNLHTLYFSAANPPLINTMTTYGRVFSWMVPLGLASWMGLAFYLKSCGKMLPANILTWIPALPLLGGLFIWGGLAAVFILFGASK